MTKKKLFDERMLVVGLVSLITVAVLLFVDLFTKMCAEVYRWEQPAYFLGLVRLYFVKNDGIAFSLFGGNEVMMTIVTILTAFMIVAIIVLFFTLFKSNTPAQITLAVIEAGAIGNFVDRVSLGYVRDFIDVGPLGFGVCNPADFYITFGAVAFFFILIFIGEDALFPLKKSWREKAKEKEEAKAEAGRASKENEKL